MQEGKVNSENKLISFYLRPGRIQGVDGAVEGKYHQAQLGDLHSEPLTLPLTSCVTLGKPLTLSVPQ